MRYVYDFRDSVDQIMLVIVLMFTFTVGFCVGIVVGHTDTTMLEKDVANLKEEVDFYAEREFSIMLKGRMIEIWDSMGLLDSVSIGDGDGQDSKY